MNRLKYLTEVGEILNKAKKIAYQYYQKTSRPLGIAGEVAEYEAIRLLKLDTCVARQPGYDATKRKKGADEKFHEIKYQIKGRTLQQNSKPGQRVGSINLKHEWDYVLLVMLNDQFEPEIIYQASREDIIRELTKPGSKARNARGQLGVSKFKSISDVAWCRK